MPQEMEEDKASDLVLVMEILSNVLSKDILVLAGYEGSIFFAVLYNTN